MKSIILRKKLGSYILVCFVVLVFISSCIQHKSSVESQKNNDSIGPVAELCVGDYLTEEEAAEKLQEYSKLYSNADEWKERARKIKENIWKGAEMDQIPKAEWIFPIKLTKGAIHKMNGYIVENQALEVKPGYFIYGNLYLPEKNEGKMPAVLCPHGHWFESGNYGRFRPNLQYRCAALARMGAVVFTWDMLGSGEDHLNDHMDPKAVQKQSYNSIRVLDYISSLPYVDTTRIAVTGASGGGTQTFLLAALDDRIDVSVPTVMVSAHFFGGCVCESRMPIHKRGNFETDNVEIAASISPKPLLLIADGGDWTKNVPKVEYPYIKRIYDMFGAGDNVEYAYFPNEHHDYGFSKRKAAYSFLVKHLGLDYSKILDQNGKVTESSITLLDTTSLKVFPDRSLVVDPQHYNNK